MIVPISAGTATRLEKAAWDNGFDREATADPGWLSFVSTHAPLRIWLGAVGEELFIVAFSQANVAQSLGQGTTLASPLPAGAVASRTVAGIPNLHRLVRRAFQLSRTLPDELLQKFQNETEGLPCTTEVERMVVQRVGQDIFRSDLMERRHLRGRRAKLQIPLELGTSFVGDHVPGAREDGGEADDGRLVLALEVHASPASHDRFPN